MASIENAPKKHKKINLIKILFFVILICLGVIVYMGAFDSVVSVLKSKQYTYKIAGLKLTPYKVIRAFLHLVVLLWLSGKLSFLIERMLTRSSHVGAGNRALIVKITSIAFYTISVLIALRILGVDIASITVFGGAIGIGIGFGLQKIASNFISGIILLFEKTINEGNLIELPNGSQGFVRKTKARYTLVETFDGKEIMIPNEDFITNRVVNWTFSDKLGRLEIKVGVSYDSDYHKARQIIMDIISSHKLCSRKKPPECSIISLGQYSIDFLAYMWLDDVTDGKQSATHDIYTSILDKFQEAGIKIPYPKTDIHLVK